MKYTSVLAALICFSSFAQEVNVSVLTKVKNTKFPIGIGSKVQLDFKTKNETRDGIFLGRMVDLNNKNIEFLFLDLKKTRISMIDPGNVTGFQKSSSQPIIRPIDQKGSTCATYAVFHFWNQMYVMGFPSNEVLPAVMSSDRQRMQFLEEAIEAYYINLQTNLTKLLQKFGKRYGFKCKNNPFTDPKLAAEFIFKKTLEGKPVLIEFNIAKDMVTSTYENLDFENPVKTDARLWLPRKIGQRTTSGHAIVAASAFVAKGRRKVLVLDSDWSEPRVWDLDKYIGKKAAVKEMGFHTCN